MAEKTMTEREYFSSIARIRAHTAAGELEEAERLLDRMYMYKPVRLLWFVAKAEFIVKKNADPPGGINYLNDKFQFIPGYSGLDECMEFRLPILRQYCETRDAIREEYAYRKVRGEDCSAQEDALARALEQYARDSEDKEALMALGDAFYHTFDLIAYLIVRLEQLRTGALPEDFRGYWFYQIANYGYLEEKIKSDRPNAFILMMDGHLDRELEIIGTILSGFGHEIFLLTPPLVFETEERVELKDTVAISLEQTEHFPDMRVIPPITLTQDGKPYGDNRACLIDHICREESGRDNAVVLCSGLLLEDLCVRAELRGRIGRLSTFSNDAVEEEKLQFGWAGSYLSYISDIYGYDVRASLNAPAEVDFSIVIPARNSAETLRYTLETCLNQRYRGSYEIVVSDNSVDQDDGVYELCRELDDPRIRYVRTPRLLQLTKSFEFAYLQARGAFVLSIGSDDAMLPWGLAALNFILNQFPEEDIIQWERGFYAWPGFNEGQEHMLQIPGKYERGPIPVLRRKTEDILKDVAQDIGKVYEMPMLYINSGFRRRYLEGLLQKTGKLWDGGNQDMHMGIVNCCRYGHVLQMLYPITIAGMSNASLGYLGRGIAAGAVRKRAEELRKRQWKQDNVGTYISLSRERLLMPVGVDACSLYLVLSRAVEEGLLPADAADQILDWKTAVWKAFETYLIINDNYDLFVHSVKAAAEQMGKPQADWFMEQIYHTVLTPRRIDENAARRGKFYREGADQFGGETLDASKYGVHNVAEAASLFALRTGL